MPFLEGGRAEIVMGGIHFSGNEMAETLMEIVGFKCGIAISKGELVSIYEARGYPGFAQDLGMRYQRVHSSQFEEMVFELLRHFGRVRADFTKFPEIEIYHSVKRDEAKLAIYNDVMSLYVDMLPGMIERARASGAIALDPKALVSKVFGKHGMDGIGLLTKIFMGMNESLNASPWSQMRQVEWEDSIDLKDLFESERLNASYGSFFDQRYVDFLHRNFERIDSVHWRKFEQLTAEFLERAGYEVALGPGRGDDGVDVRAWRKDRREAPHIVVQCKRQKDAVPKVVLKALYADLIHEKANSGLIVTTSHIAPGANDTRTARSYPIDVADRDTLRTWLEQMRTPRGWDLLGDTD